MAYCIFDIDGTIADITHRRHFVASKPKNWGAFNRAMKDDTPHQDIIELMRMMRLYGYQILIASGRGEEDREKTVQWLTDQGIVQAGVPASTGIPIYYRKLYMRPAGDYRSDNIVKSEILDEMLADGYKPTMAFDDRDQVVKMWRERGLRCLQVAEGSF
jgi:hypothetical protein